MTSGGFSLRLLVRALVYAALYFVAMVSSIELARFGGNVAPIWAASAIFAWALVSAPLRDWPLLIGFTAVAHATAGIFVGDQLAVEAVYLIANIMSPIVCAGLLRWRSDELEFEDRGSVLRFLLISSLAAASSAAIVGAWSFMTSGQLNWRDTGTWFLSDGLSFIVFMPIFKSLASGKWRELLASSIRMRALLMFSILVVALALDWVAPDSFRRILPTLLLPYLIYMAFELGATGARAATAITAASFLAYALLGSESTRRGLPPVDYIFTVQIYLAALVAGILPLAAALTEKQKLYETASNALADAQAAWGDLIAAEAHYRLIADNAEEMILRVARDGAIIFASPACKRLSRNVDDLNGRNFADLAHADDAPRARDSVAKAAADGVIDHPHAMQLRLRDATGAAALFDIRLTLVAAGNREPEEFIAVLREVQQ